jgi:hypothetical protein
MIDSYAFGRMVVAGNTYTSDLIIFPDRIHSSWWRKKGHRLCLEDIQDVVKEDIEVLVIGTGYMGLMKVEDEVKQYARSHGIRLVVEKTTKAAESFNNLFQQKKTAGAFHLTC